MKLLQHYLITFARNFIVRLARNLRTALQYGGQKTQLYVVHITVYDLRTTAFNWKRRERGILASAKRPSKTTKQDGDMYMGSRR